MLQYYLILFFIMTCISGPIYVYQYQMYKITNAKPQHFAYIDMFSYGAIYNLINANEAGPLRVSYTDAGGSISYKIDGGEITKHTEQFLPSLVYIISDHNEHWYYLWYSVFVLCTFLCSFMYFCFYQLWKGDADELLVTIDEALTSPSDFTVELKARRGICGCCKAYPMAHAGSGQILAMVDACMDPDYRIFEEPLEYWESDVKEDLNVEFNDQNQLPKLLYNGDSPYHLKAGLAVKKLDNSIYAFKELAEKSKAIVREKSRIYQTEKILNPEATDQYLEDLVNGSSSDDRDILKLTTLKLLLEEYKLAYSNIVKSRENAVEYDELDTLYGYVSFRTQEYREKFEEKLEAIHSCYYCKYYLCCCCFKFPMEYHWRNDKKDYYRIYAKRASDEPGDIVWENIYISESEKNCRYCVYFTGLNILLVFSLAAMLVAVVYQNTLPKSVDCTSVAQLFIDDISTFKADYDNISSGQTIIDVDSELTVSSIPVADFTTWKESVTLSINDGSLLSLAAQSDAGMKDLIKDHYSSTFYCYCINNIANSTVASAGTCKTAIEEYSIISSLPILITVGVSILDAILDAYINDGIDFIRPPSKSAKLSNQVYYNAVASFTNMALIPVLTGYDWDLPVVKALFGSKVYEVVANFSQANAKDINGIWYQLVGYQLLSNFFLNAITPCITAILKALFYACMTSLQLYFSDIYIREDFIELYQGPKYPMDKQYSYFLNHIAVCLTFAPGMPILYPVAFVGTLFLYHSDKIALLMTYRKPIDVNDTVNKAANSFIYGILILNIMWSCYTYSNNQFFCSDTRYCATPTERFSIGRIFIFNSEVSKLINGNYSTDEELNLLLSNNFPTIIFNILLFICIWCMIFEKSSYSFFKNFYYCLFWRCCAKKNTKPYAVHSITDEQEQNQDYKYAKEEVLDEDPFARENNNDEEYEPEYSRKYVHNAIYSYNLFDNPEYNGIIKELKDMSDKKSGRDSLSNLSIIEKKAVKKSQANLVF
eukprot:Mrub_00447.p1 GENE.Mrub_00447~~Mrub_00447.p1  ORF type:complete len:1049 (+),score=163.44 Mrub_00447:160-3147(+)